jgi:hypothetical protein
MAGEATVRFNQGALDRLLASEAGPVGRLILRKTLAVERGAKRRVRVDTGRLRASIQSHLERERGTVVGVVGTNVAYAAYIEFDVESYLRAALADAGGVV